MQIAHLEISNYRSIRDVRFDLTPLTVIVGANGSGKSNLYQSLRLLHSAAKGELARTLAAEGGMPSVLWAGQWKKKERRRISIAVEVDEFEYKLTLGLRPHQPGDPSKFVLDPVVKAEKLVFLGSRRTVLMDRKVGTSHVRDHEGRLIVYPARLAGNESLLAQVAEPHRSPELSVMREGLLSWRFYHDFPTDAAAPARQNQVGVLSPVLAHDGSNLAAALQTILEIGRVEALEAAVARAFPRSQLRIEAYEGRFGITLTMGGLKRPLTGLELSDGTLRYLYLVAALLSPRPPAVLALNEPENSLHSDLMIPLAELIVAASERSQIWVTTHSRALANQIERRTGRAAIELAVSEGQTTIVGQNIFGYLPDSGID